MNRLPGAASNKIYADIVATRSFILPRPVLTETPLAVILLGSNKAPFCYHINLDQAGVTRTVTSRRHSGASPAAPKAIHPPSTGTVMPVT